MTTTEDVWADMDSRTAPIPRDRYGRPLIPPATGGKPKAYTRVTTLAETLDDRYNLEKWKQRQVAVGLMLRPDLLALVAAQQNDKGQLDHTCDEAIAAAKGGAAGNTGTALHALTERLDKGEDLGHIPEVLRADLDAYRACIDRHGIEVVEVEQFVVCEALEAAGTLDRLGRVRDRLCVFDIKTGAGAVDYGLPSISVQLAIYAHAETSWSTTDGHVGRKFVISKDRVDPTRSYVVPAHETFVGSKNTDNDQLVEVDKSRAYVIHLLPGSGRCELVEVDIVSGWQAAQTAKWVREWRKRSDLGRSVTDAADTLGFRREWVAQRVRALPQGAVDMLARMVADHGNLPRVSVSADAHLDDWVELLDLVEAEHEVPFGTRDPSKPAKRGKK